MRVTKGPTIPPWNPRRAAAPGVATLRTLLVLLTLGPAWATGAACASGEADASEVDLGRYGERVRLEVAQIALDHFTRSPEGHRRFTEIYASIHHRARAADFLSDLAADPELASLGTAIGTTLDAALRAGDRDTQRVRERWSDPAVQSALAHTVAGAVVAASDLAAGSGPATRVSP